MSDSERILFLEAALLNRDQQVASLESQLALALTRIAELQTKLGLNSQNSSKPPSSNPPHFQHSPKPPTGKKTGAQPGHKGHKRELAPPQEVTHFISQIPTQCQHCMLPLTGQDPAPQLHQVIDIAPIKPIITEYQLHKLTCRACGKETQNRC